MPLFTWERQAYLPTFNDSKEFILNSYVSKNQNDQNLLGLGNPRNVFSGVDRSAAGVASACSILRVFFFKARYANNMR